MGAVWCGASCGWYRAMSQSGGRGDGPTQFSENTKEGDIRASNFLAAKAVAEAIRTSLGPRGMDKMISDEHGEVLISNDGATLLKKMKVIHPAAKMMVERRFMLVGGGAPEVELSLRLSNFGKKLGGRESYCVRAFADALEVVPYTLAENAGLDPIAIVTDLRARHVKGETTAGINVRKGCITDLKEENVLQPLLVTESALTLATETVCMIL